MTIAQIALAACLGFGLAASTGLNTSLPLLLLAAAARFHIAGITLNEKFAWLTSDVAIIVLIIAATAEVIADKFPAVDHVLDSVGTFVRPVAGAIAAASVFTGLDATTAAIVGLIVGSPISFAMHSAKAAARVTSSATTFGCANPLLSLAEDLMSIALSVMAMLMPLLVPVLVLLVVIILVRIARVVRRRSDVPV